MLHAVHGTLVSEYVAEHLLAERFARRLGEEDRDRARRTLGRIARACRSLGPASSIRAVFDVGAAALAEMLGFRVAQVRARSRSSATRTSLARGTQGCDGEGALATVLEHDRVRVALLVAPWGEHLDAAWRDSILLGIDADVRWCLLFNGRQVRLVDSSRSYGRDHLEFDLDAACEDAASFDLLWAVLRAQAFAPEVGAGEGRLSLLDEIIALSARHGVSVCRYLQDGVLEALSALMQGFANARAASLAVDRSATSLSSLFEQSLTVVYRILFLLFAEARRLVPTWHAIYRDAYSIETLREIAENPGPRAVVGLWETLRAISRLAHRGCHAGSLVVTPFNGRLFSPARTPLAESDRLDDRVARRAIVALSTQDAGAGKNRARIAYRDLGVEQLGAVYETVLDYRPRLELTDPGLRTPDHRRRSVRPGVLVRLEKGGGRRKATGTFYTPRALTGYLVRRTLHPLVEHASAEEILRLRVLDPAMGSGAFLVAACRYLASCYERALVAGGERHPSEVDERDRAMFRRVVAQRCLFGVDLNPTAVQLARLSLWLATLAADRPLTFLDHHLGVGDSLVGASAMDVLRYPGRRGRSSAADRYPGLFEDEDLRADLGRALPERLRIALEPGDTLSAVQDKERAIRRLARPDGPLARWKDAADLWCACWFWDGGDAPSRGVYHDLVDCLVGRRAGLPAASARPVLDRARAIAKSRAFFHWETEFPEVFFDATGGSSDEAGFDAVIGNPPWDMLRADEVVDGGDKAYDRALIAFARRSQLYTAQADGHPNRFQLFVERAFHLARPGGRLGLVVPWGLFSDRGCRNLRRLLLERADTDSVVGFENGRAIFPIHRSVRFALLTATTGRPTTRTVCRFGERDLEVLDALPDDPGAPATPAGRHRGPGAPAMVLSPPLLARLSGDDLAIPDLRSPIDLEILEQAAAAFPALAAPQGWGAHFSRELNASDDRHHFVEGRVGLPVVEGKHLEPFVAHVGRSGVRIPTDVAARILGRDGSFLRARLAYRDVASATNRVTLIAAILPPGCVTTHTLFCLRTSIDEHAQWFLCGMMNSYVVNYFVRMRVTTHVSAGIVERLPVPVPSVDTGPGAEIVAASRRIAARVPGVTDDRLQALVARLYALTAPQFSHILSTFPLIGEDRRRGAYEEFNALHRCEVRGG